MKKNKAAVIPETGRFDNAGSAVIIISVSKAVQTRRDLFCTALEC